VSAIDRIPVRLRPAATASGSGIENLEGAWTAFAKATASRAVAQSAEAEGEPSARLRIAKTAMMARGAARPDIADDRRRPTKEVF
jgi:hypothetical protein